MVITISSLFNQEEIIDGIAGSQLANNQTFIDLRNERYRLEIVGI